MADIKATQRSHLTKKLPLICSIAAFSLGSNTAQGDLTDVLNLFANDLERAAAIANQQTYQALVGPASGGGPCQEDQRVEMPGCDGATFTVFQNVRKLVHTANEFTRVGATQFSLGLNLAELGHALRWTGGEEFAAQGSLTSRFINGQLSGLSSRLTALRFGAAGFGASGFGASGFTTAANNSSAESSAALGRSGMLGGGASADSGDGYSRWGGFLNGTYGVGDKRATVFENAFDFDGYQLNAGIDYRLDDNWVLGTILGYTGQEIEFDPSQSIVDGEIEADGFSIMPFVLYQSEKVFGSVSIGYQSMDLDTDRAIRFTSLNPMVTGTDTRALSTTDADIITVFANLGYSFRRNAVSVEPYLEFESRGVSIDGFTERDINGSGYGFTVGDQDIDSTELALGLTMQYTLTPTSGVFIPYLDAQWRHQFEADSRNISARFAGTALAAEFTLPTDKLDDQYYVITVGLSSILRGGRQEQAGGTVSGGIQVFVNYKYIGGLDNYSEDVLAGGIRYEF